MISKGKSFTITYLLSIIKSIDFLNKSEILIFIPIGLYNLSSFFIFKEKSSPIADISTLSLQ